MAEGDARRLDLPGTCLWSAPRQPGLPGPHHVGEWVSLGGPERVGTEGVLGLLPSPPQVLITKLRSANSAETRQYHKASKALLVLIPLLGITYLVLLYAPSDGFLRHAFAFLRACLISTQVGGEGRAGSRGTQSQSPLFSCRASSSPCCTASSTQRCGSLCVTGTGGGRRDKCCGIGGESDCPAEPTEHPECPLTWSTGTRCPRNSLRVPAPKA